MSKEKELKPCPFCGCNAEYFISEHLNRDTTQEHRIICTNVFGCGVEMHTYISPYSKSYEDETEQFAKRWNKRANQKALEKQTQ